MSWYKIVAQDDSAEVSIFGDVGASWWGDSVTLADFKKDFDKIKDKNSISVLINSPGGDVFDGMGIYNIISAVRQKVSVEVLGLAASIASIIALAGKELIIGEGSFFMIHRPWAFAMGNSDDLRKSADLLDKIDEQMVAIYMQHTTMSQDELVAAMTDETWYAADEAVEAGFATGTVDYGQLAASYDLSRYKFAHVPTEMAGAEKPSEAPSNIRDFEERLRGMGFSNRDAKAIASHGFAHRDDAEPEVEQTDKSDEQGVVEEETFDIGLLMRARKTMSENKDYLRSKT